MNINAKFKQLGREIEALKARVTALEVHCDYGEPVDAAHDAAILKAALAEGTRRLAAKEAADEVAITKRLCAIETQSPIAASIEAPPPKRRGRPPKPKV